MKITGRKTLIGGLGALVAGTIIGLPSPVNNENPKLCLPPETPKTAEYSTPKEQLAKRLEDENYIPSLDDFKLALEKRYQPKRNEELKTEWERLKSKQRVTLCNLYITGGETYEKASSAIQSDYKIWNIKQLSAEEQKKLEEKTPWDLIPSNSESEADKAAVYFLSFRWLKHVKTDFF